MKRKNWKEINNLYYSALGHYELFKETKESLFAEAAITAYMRYRDLGGKEVEPKLERIRLKRKEAREGVQLSFLNGIPNNEPFFTVTYQD